MLSRGSCRLKILIHFESISGGPDKITLSASFSLFGRKIFSISVFEIGMLSRGSCRLKIWIHFESISGGPDKILHLFCLSGLCCALFLIHDEYSIGLNVEFPIRSSS